MMPPKKKLPPKRKWWHEYAQLSHLGVQIAAGVLLGVLLGGGIDYFLFSSKYPFLWVLGGGIGIFAALFGVIKEYGNSKR